MVRALAEVRKLEERKDVGKALSEEEEEQLLDALRVRLLRTARNCSGPFSASPCSPPCGAAKS